MIIVTGGAGFIGSNIIDELNKQGLSKILVVDNLSNKYKFYNLSKCQIIDFLDVKDFVSLIENNKINGKEIEYIFHQGACSDTTNWNLNYVMSKNFNFSKQILHWSQVNKIPLVYASSASVYGNGKDGFSEDLMDIKTLNPYAFSKLLFDKYVYANSDKINSQVVGLRYFNVYGPGEFHKNNMASVLFKFFNQIQENNTIRLFGESHNCNAGEQSRDFVHVSDCVKVNLWFYQNQNFSGCFNVGTGISRTFNDLAKIFLNKHKSAKLSYIPFPENLSDSYQSFTQADLTKLKMIGYQEDFFSLEDGAKSYLNFLNSHKQKFNNID